MKNKFKAQKIVIFVISILIVAMVVLIQMARIKSDREKENISKGQSNSSIIQSSEESEVRVVPPFEVQAKSVYLYDLEKEEVIYAENENHKIAPASLIKILTFIVAAENESDLSKEIVFHESMTDELLNYGYTLDEIATIDLLDGEIITLEEALNIMLVRSSNDVANLIATYIGGDIPNFVEMMNKKAQEIGALNTTVKNPHGLDEEGFETTAFDMFLITRKAMENPLFMEICTKTNYSLRRTNMHAPREIETYVFMQNEKYADRDLYYEYTRGIKTGFTSSAGWCLASSAEKNGANLLMISMGYPVYGENDKKNGPEEYMGEVTEIYEWAFSQNI